MVPTALTGSHRFQLDLSAFAALTGLNPTTSAQTFQQTINWAFGVAAGQVNEAYVAVRTLAAGASETLDLVGVLSGLFGQTISFARIKGILIALLTAPEIASSITVGDAASDPWLGPLGGTTPMTTVTSGDCWQQTRSDATGWAVGGGAGENLKVANDDGTNSATYLVALLGCTT